MSIIKVKRKELELSRRQLGNKLGVSRQTVERWENGQAPTIFDVKKIYKVLKINFTDLLQDYINKESEVTK